MHQMHQIALYLHPGQDVERLAIIVTDPDGSEHWGAWNLPGVPPSAEQMAEVREAALARYTAGRELTEMQAMLDARYRMFNRATASGNAEDAAEIQGEVREILAYMQEVRDAAGVA